MTGISLNIPDNIKFSSIKKNKVIQIIDSLNPGGAETLAVHIANELAALGHHSHLCTTRTEGDLKSKINDDVGFFYMNKKSAID